MKEGVYQALKIPLPIQRLDPTCRNMQQARDTPSAPSSKSAEAESYLPPFLCLQHAVARRGFEARCLCGRSVAARHRARWKMTHSCHIRAISPRHTQDDSCTRDW